MSAEVLIHAKKPALAWDTINNARLGNLTMNDWGPDGGQFDMPGDLDPFTPVEVEIAGTKVWAGETIESLPALNDSQQRLRGGQYQLDDDPFERHWVHTNLKEWSDLKSSFDAQNIPAAMIAPGFALEHENKLIFGWIRGAVATAGYDLLAGIYLDFGPDVSDVKQVSFGYTAWSAMPFPWNTLTTLYVQNMSNGPNTDPVGETVLAENFNTLGTTGARTITFAAPRRYVRILLYFEISGATDGFTFAANNLIMLNSIRCFRSTAYASGGASILKANQVVTDGLPFAPGLSQSAVDLAVPATALTAGYAPLELRSLRDHAETVYAPYGHQLSVGPELRLRARTAPTVPLYNVAGDFSGARGGSGDVIYNRVIATGQDDASRPLRVTRTSAQLGIVTFLDKLVPVRYRTKFISASGPTDLTTLTALADTELRNSSRIKMSTSLSLGIGDITGYLSGEDVHPSRLLTAYGELVILENAIDPDTGDKGRQARVISGSYEADSEVMTLRVDEDRGHPQFRAPSMLDTTH
ncbi:MAG: hypothetical protein H0U53_00165 [Actinobacteria bacterium]|nr:hypothetical protein [Actinomycetota bacterium]